jgi:hypothetical protein
VPENVVQTVGLALQFILFAFSLFSFWFGSFRTVSLFFMVFVLIAFDLCDTAFTQRSTTFALSFQNLFSYSSLAVQPLNEGSGYDSYFYRNFVHQGSGDIRAAGGLAFILQFASFLLLVILELARRISSNFQRACSFNCLLLCS